MAKIFSLESPLLRIDWLALLVTLLLLGTGLIFIGSAGYGDDTIPLLNRQWFRQFIFVLISLPVYFSISLIDYRWFKELSPVIYGGCLVLLVGVLIFGKTKNGATSWYDLKIVDFQPAEIAKIGLVICLAAYLGDPLRNTRHPRIIFVPLALTGGIFLLILKQPDFGTAMILPCVVMALLFVACISWRMIGLILFLGLMTLPLAWGVAKDYQKERVLVFLNPDRDPLGASWNRRQSEMAVGSGGLSGKGIGQGTQNLLGFLPTTVAPTDFIFSVIAEEKGFIGSATLLGLYSLLFGCLARTAVRASDMFGRLIAIGILTMLSVHVTINVAMTIGLMPIVGLPLPLVSYGGSFVVSMMLALGLVQSVHSRRS
ncbi:rod shape-determining protein RodA [Kiritimatiellaeota bacterium B1221]|nr:rod shape-determining protein RodA [Kiritimatiellaeota bacterium B1221]